MTDFDPPTPAAAKARRTRRSTADYRWTQPKVLAFLTALSQCGRVDEAARAVGMSRTSAYRLRARMASARFDAAFEGARRKGIRARAEVSRLRAEAAARSPWEGPGIAAMVARKRARSVVLEGDTGAAQGDAADAQGDTARSQGDAQIPQGCADRRKVAR